MTTSTLPEKQRRLAKRATPACGHCAHALSDRKGTAGLADILASACFWPQSQWLVQSISRRADRSTESISSWLFHPLCIGQGVQLGETKNAAPINPNFQPLVKALGIALKALIRINRRLVVSENGVNQWGLLWSNGIVNPFAIFASRDQSRLTDDLKMRGQSGLAHLHRVGQFTHAQLTVTQGGDDANARRIGKGFCKKNEVVHHRIVTSGYNDIMREPEAFVKGNPLVLQKISANP